MRVSKNDQQNILKFWQVQSLRFLNLTVIAAAVFGAPASAGAINVDFGEAGRMITASRTGLSATFVEMVQVISRNKKLVDFGQVIALHRDQTKNCIPKSRLQAVLDPEDEVMMITFALNFRKF